MSVVTEYMPWKKKFADPEILAKRDRLREALQAALDDYEADCGQSENPNPKHWTGKARAALAGTAPNEPQTDESATIHLCHNGDRLKEINAELLAALVNLLDQSMTNRACYYEKGGKRLSNEAINMTSAAELIAKNAIIKAADHDLLEYGAEVIAAIKAQPFAVQRDILLATGAIRG